MFLLNGWCGKIIDRAVCWTNGRGAVVMYSKIFGKSSLLTGNEHMYCPVGVPGVTFETSPFGHLMANSKVLSKPDLASVVHTQVIFSQQEENQILDDASVRVAENIREMHKYANAFVNGVLCSRAPESEKNRALQKYETYLALASANQEYARLLARIRVEEDPIVPIDDAIVLKFAMQAEPFIFRRGCRPFVRVCAGSIVSVEE